MKVGVLTFHDGFNYGGFAQAYALESKISQLGYDVEIINYKPMGFALKEYKVFLGTLSPRVFFKNLSKILSFKKDQKQLRQTNWYRKTWQIKEEYDIVIIGSDSVFNYTNPLIGYDPAYFGEGLPTQKISSYAASFGPDRFEDGFPEELRLAISNFDNIAVRDSNSQKFIEKLGRKSLEVLDPTFLYTFDKEIIEPRERDYILVYSYILESKEIEAIKSYSDKTGLKIISVGYKWDFADKNYDSIGPFEWLGFIKKAKFVVTGMYHGTLLSIQMNKNFVSLVTPYRKNKIQHVLGKLRLSERMYESNVDRIEKLKCSLETEVSYSEVNKIVSHEIAKCEMYLLKCLND